MIWTQRGNLSERNVGWMSPPSALELKRPVGGQREQAGPGAELSHRLQVWSDGEVLMNLT